jgi:putative intracellular protease/amidase
MPSSILVVITSNARLGDSGKSTGVWLEEVAAPFLAFKDAGHAVTLASPKGGQPPVDPGSEAEGAQTEATRRFKADAAAVAALAATHTLAEVAPGAAQKYDAVFYPGGHGGLWDLAGGEARRAAPSRACERPAPPMRARTLTFVAPHAPFADATSIALIESFAAAGKPIGAVCHGPAVLVACKKPDGARCARGAPPTARTALTRAAPRPYARLPAAARRLSARRRPAGRGLHQHGGGGRAAHCRACEARRSAARRARPPPAPLSHLPHAHSPQVVPFLLEDKFKELGALYSKVADWVRSRGGGRERRRGAERESPRARSPRPPLAPPRRRADAHPASLRSPARRRRTPCRERTAASSSRRARTRPRARPRQRR